MALAGALAVLPASAGAVQFRTAHVEPAPVAQHGRAGRARRRRKSLVRFQLVATFTDARGNRAAARRGSKLRRPR